MSRALMLKTVYEQWLATLLFAVGFGAVAGLLAYVIPTLLSEHAEKLLQIELVRQIARGLLGTDLGERLDPASVHAFVWVHPVVLALYWAQAIAFCTTMPAAEVERGTVDIALSLPVSRFRHYACHSAVWLAAGVLMVLFALTGNRIGARLGGHDGSVWIGRLLVVCVNLFAVSLAVGGIACLVSSLSDRRGRAVGAAFALIIASFFVNFLAQLWQPAKGVAFLSLMHYYRPPAILRDPSTALRDTLVLTLVAAATWLSGAWVFSRRDFRAS